MPDALRAFLADWETPPFLVAMAVSARTPMTLSRPLTPSSLRAEGAPARGPGTVHAAWIPPRSVEVRTPEAVQSTVTLAGQA